MWLDPEKLKQFILEAELLPAGEVEKLCAEVKSSGKSAEEVFLASGR